MSRFDTIRLGRVSDHSGKGGRRPSDRATGNEAEVLVQGSESGAVPVHDRTRGNGRALVREGRLRDCGGIGTAAGELRIGRSERPPLRSLAHVSSSRLLLGTWQRVAAVRRRQLWSGKQEVPGNRTSVRSCLGCPNAIFLRIAAQLGSTPGSPASRRGFHRLPVAGRADRQHG